MRSKFLACSGSVLFAGRWYWSTWQGPFYWKPCSPKTPLVWLEFFSPKMHRYLGRGRMWGECGTGFEEKSRRAFVTLKEVACALWDGTSREGWQSIAPRTGPGRVWGDTTNRFAEQRASIHGLTAERNLVLIFLGIEESICPWGSFPHLPVSSWRQGLCLPGSWHWRLSSGLKSFGTMLLENNNNNVSWVRFSTLLYCWPWGRAEACNTVGTARSTTAINSWIEELFFYVSSCSRLWEMWGEGAQGKAGVKSGSWAVSALLAFPLSSSLHGGILWRHMLITFPRSLHEVGSSGICVSGG